MAIYQGLIQQTAPCRVLVACPFPLFWPGCGVPPSVLLAYLVPHWSCQVSASDDWFLYLKPFPHTQLAHHPDNGGSKDL
jgi:hypothetical protein